MSEFGCNYNPYFVERIDLLPHVSDVVEIDCKGCKEPFWAYPGETYYCNLECQNGANRERMKNHVKRDIVPIPCLECNIEFMPKSILETICSETCKRTRINTRQRELMHRRKIVNPIRCATCDEYFTPSNKNLKICSPECKEARAVMQRRASYLARKEANEITGGE